MKKSFQKSLIAASVGAVMMAAVGTASANSLLFPYFTTASGAHSVLSLSTNAAATAAGETLHYVYNYGDSCTHYDGNGKMTNNDLLQHSVADPALAGGFGKVTGTDTSTPFYFPLNEAGKNYGFLVVSTKTAAAAKISGDMAIVDPATGLVVSYAGIDNALVDTTAANEGNFTNIRDSLFNLSFYPEPMVATSWYGVVAGDMNAAIAGGLDWKGEATLNNGNTVFDNDEHPFSGNVDQKLTCAGTVKKSTLMNSAQQAAVGPSGGLMHVTAGAYSAVAPNIANGVVMNKLQVVKAAVGAPFAGKMFLHREQAPAF